MKHRNRIYTATERNAILATFAWALVTGIGALVALAWTEILVRSLVS